MLVTPVTSAKIEGMFLCMAGIKTDWCDRLGHDHLDVLLQIDKGMPKIVDFDPNKPINILYDNKTR